MHAELAYLFRHGLIRDAAYELQTPSTRAALHGLALRLIEGLHGGRPKFPDLATTMEAHALDPMANELALHASRAEGPEFATAHANYLWRAAAFADHRNDPRRAIEFYKELSRHTAITEEERLAAARNFGWLLHTTGRTNQAKEALEQALARATGEGLEREESRLCTVLGQLYNELGQNAQAWTTLERALVFQRKAGLKAEESRALTYMANTAQKTGKVEQAEVMYRHALSLAQEAQDQRGMGVALANLATVLVRLKRLDEAETTYRRALELQQKIGNKRIEGVVLGNLANLLHDKGDHKAAEGLYMQALEIQRAYGNRRSEGFVLGNLGGLYAATDRLDSAEQCYGQALAIHEQVGARWSLAVHRCDYALLKLRQGEPAVAAEVWGQGAAFLRQLGDKSELEDKANAMRKACEAAGVPAFAVP